MHNALWFPDIGKLRCQPQIGESSSASSSKRLYVADRATGRRYLIDTGADISVVPPPAFHKLKPIRKFTAANGTKILGYGEQLMVLDLGLRRPLKWVFTIADVTHAIIGADFVHHFDLMVDLRRKRIQDRVTSLEVIRLCIISRQLDNQFARKLADYHRTNCKSQKPSLHICANKGFVAHQGVHMQVPSIWSKSKMEIGGLAETTGA